MKRKFLYILLLLYVVVSTSAVPTEHPAIAENKLLQKIEQFYIARKFSDAKQECTQATAKYPNSLAFFYICGKAIIYAPGDQEAKKQDYATAIKFLEKALPAYKLNLKRREQLTNVLFHLGLAWQQSLNYDMAIYWYREALKADDRKSAAWFNLGVCYEIQGNVIEANRAWLQYQDSLRKLDDDF